MNNDILEGKWKQFKGEAKRRWSEISDDDFDRIDGKKDELIGAIQEKYGKTKQQAEQEFDELREKLES